MDLIKLSKLAGIKIQIGGGIRSIEVIEELVNRGTDRIILGTIAFDDNKLSEILSKQYRSKIAIALDYSKRTIRTKGWQYDTHIETYLVFAKLENLGIHDFIVTDIMKDGTSTGLDTYIFLELMKKKKSLTRELLPQVEFQT